MHQHQHHPRRRGPRNVVAAVKSMAKTSGTATNTLPPTKPSRVHPHSARQLLRARRCAKMMRAALPLKYGSNTRIKRKRRIRPPSLGASSTLKPSIRRRGAASPARRPRARSKRFKVWIQSAGNDSDVTVFVREKRQTSNHLPMIARFTCIHQFTQWVR